MPINQSEENKAVDTQRLEITETRNVAGIGEAKLCCSCGGCVWVCPRNAISLVETVGGYLLPNINPASCAACGMCLSICPGAGLDKDVADLLPQDCFAGACLQALVGKATDPIVFNNSQSGGIVTALLAHALENGEIGGAVITLMEHGNPPRPAVNLARSVEEIKQAQKSKYAPVPLLVALEEVECLNKPVALVGVACHIHGLLNILARFPRLKSKIKFVIGLVCDRVMTLAAIDFLVGQADLLCKDNTMLHFRDKLGAGYPGNVHIITASGASVSLPPSTRVQMKDFFTPARCRLCFDKMNVLADIVVCDPHGIPGIDRKGGESVAIIRTETGRRIFQSAIEQSALIARVIKYEDVLAGQKINKKRTMWRGYTDAWQQLGYPRPGYSAKVDMSAGPLQKRPAYLRQLQHALSLDNHVSRENLLKRAKRHLYFQKLKKLSTYSYLASQKVFESIMKLVCWRG